MEPIVNFFKQYVFGEKLDVLDDREPVWSFDVMGKNFELLPPSLSFWNQMTALCVVQSLFVLLTSGLTYFLILNHSQAKKDVAKSLHAPSGQALLVGYGIVLPLCIYYPRILYQVLDIRNYVLRFAFLAVPMAGLFRCTEAMYGFAPASTTGSFKTYFFYWLAPVEQETLPDSTSKEALPASATRQYFIEKLIAFLVGFVKMSIVLSVTSPFDFHIFPTPTTTGEQWTLQDCFSMGNFVNNFIGAFMFQQSLSTFGPGLSLIASSITGLRYKELMGNPLFQSSSPSEFWGRRWNRFVHSLLKRGVYKPVRSYYNGLAATVAAFVASGLMHEWVLWSMFAPLRNGAIATHVPAYGMQTRFFVWNAIIITLEHFVSHWLFFQSIKKRLPLVVRALLTLSLSLPVAHWFLDEYHKGGFFAHMAMAFPLVVKTNGQS